MSRYNTAADYKYVHQDVYDRRVDRIVAKLTKVERKCRSLQRQYAQLAGVMDIDLELEDD